MLDAIAFDDVDAAVVTPNRHGHRDATLGVFGPLALGVGQLKDIGGTVKLFARLFKDVSGIKTESHGRGWSKMGGSPAGRPRVTAK